MQYFVRKAKHKNTFYRKREIETNDAILAGQVTPYDHQNVRFQPNLRHESGGFKIAWLKKSIRVH